MQSQKGNWLRLYVKLLFFKHPRLKSICMPVINVFFTTWSKIHYRIHHYTRLVRSLLSRLDHRDPVYGLAKILSYPSLYIVGVGLNYQYESDQLRKWLQKRHKSKCRVLVFSDAALPLLRKHLPVLYYRDIVSQAEELKYFATAYEMIKGLSSCLVSLQPALAPFVAAVHHTWARDMFSLIVLQEKGQVSGGERKTSVAVVDIPYRANDLLYPDAARSWQYVVLNNSQEYAYKEVLKSTPEILNYYDKLFRAEQRLLGELSPYHDKKNASASLSTDSCLVLVEDSGSLINLTSGSAFILEMERRNLRPVVITSSAEIVVNELIGTGARVCRLPHELRSSVYKDFILALAELQEIFNRFIQDHKSFLWDLFAAVARPNLYQYLKEVFCIKAAIEHLCSEYEFASAVAFGEGSFLPAGAFPYFASRNIRAFGVTGVLVMDHPTCEFWPAGEHLVYGDQMLEVLTKQGISVDRIKVVGSEHFDRCQRRNKEADIKLVRSLFPQTRDKKLVVIATEARAREMIEIESSVKALARYPSIFTVIKVHPGEADDPYMRLLKEMGNPSNVVVSGSEVNTLALAHAADLVITMYSNLIIESGVMGTPSLVYNYSGTPCPMDFVKEGLCFGAYSVEEFEKLAIGLLEDNSLRKEACDKLKLISRYNGPNDGQAIKRMVDIVLKH